MSTPERAPNRKPPWLKVQMPGAPRYHDIKTKARSLRLSTVCEEARCPNIGECWGGGTATFMVMGHVCTRGCRFCAVTTRRRGVDLDPEEPANVAAAIQEMGLDYVVITSVDRDDLADGGAAHFAACIRATRAASPRTMVEVLIPDFQGNVSHVLAVVEAEPEVIAHNIEVPERLTPRIRDPRATYRQSLDVLAAIKRIDPERFTKSSIMVGLGESEDEVVATMEDLRRVDVDFLTVGQYLQPTDKHARLVEYVHPDVFERYRELGEAMGFSYVASGPLVRSSYKAGEFFIRDYIQRRRPARVPERYTGAAATP
ncbi:MAG: lipoyl synthase [Alphaproteobacteria bacterium]|nr:lipoyl synthase [Alphaproteobacteria bacterium]